MKITEEQVVRMVNLVSEFNGTIGDQKVVDYGVVMALMSLSQGNETMPLLYTDQFELYIKYGMTVLNTTFSNQNIDQEYINNFNKVIELESKIDKILEENN